jgi:hypothetical protein
MSEIVNLRQARKRAARKSAEAEAAANRAKHGLSKADRIAAADAEWLAKTLDGAKREDEPGA